MNHQLIAFSTDICFRQLKWFGTVWLSSEDSMWKNSLPDLALSARQVGIILRNQQNWGR